MAFTIPTDDRSKKLMVLTFLAVAIVGVYWWYMWKPAQAIIVATAARADTLERANEKMAADISKYSEAQIRADAVRYTRELTVLRRLVPTSNEVPTLLNSISTAARRAGMEISDFNPDGQLSGDHFDAVKFRLSVTGTFHKIAEFLTYVGSLDRIITPINLEISPSGRSIERKPGKNETFVDVKFGVLTYVAKTAPPAPIAPPKPGAR